MPNCDFYATEPDHVSLMSWIFTDGKVDVYEAYSRFESELRKFHSVEEVINCADHGMIYLQLYIPGSGPEPNQKRIQLNPSACLGATFRYSLEGWGLIQLQLMLQVNDELRSSHTNHNSIKRASTWSSTFPELGAADEWDFKKVSSYSSRLNRHIKSLAVGSLGSRPILPSAAAFLRSGGHTLPRGIGDPIWKNA